MSPYKSVPTLLMAAGLFLLAGIAFTPGAHAQGLAVKASGKKTFTLNNRVGWNQFLWLSSMPAEEIKGTAEGITGTITFDPQKPQGMKGTVSAKVATMKSGNDSRDEHLRSPMWLDAAKYPTISFTIASVSNLKFERNEMKGDATGKFTMHGVTKQIKVPFTLTYIDASQHTAVRGPGDLMMVNADFVVSLKDFKVKGREGVIGNKVGETIRITAKLYGASQP